MHAINLRNTIKKAGLPTPGNPAIFGCITDNCRLKPVLSEVEGIGFFNHQSSIINPGIRGFPSPPYDGFGFVRMTIEKQ